MQFDLIAFDVDSTLTESKQVIERGMAKLFCNLLDRYKVAIISGAAFEQFEWQILAHLNCYDRSLENLYLLPVDGTVLCTYQHGWRCEEDAPLSDSDKSRIRNAFTEALKRTGLETIGQTYGELIEDRGSQMNFSALGQTAPHELKKEWDPDNTKRLHLVEILKEIMPDFSFRIGGTTSIEATRQGIDKAYGLKKLLNLTNIPAYRTLYIGDKLFKGGNDAPALTLGMECREVIGPEETKKVIMGLLS